LALNIETTAESSVKIPLAIPLSMNGFRRAAATGGRFDFFAALDFLLDAMI